jgi:hypothetical protein
MADNGGFRCPRHITRDGASDADKWVRTRWNDAGAIWPEAVERPRTCSYCGCVNPDDVIALLVDGWTLSATDKHYKMYLVPSDGDVTPPAKVYLQHFTREQCERADEIVRVRRQFMAGTTDKPFN